MPPWYSRRIVRIVVLGAILAVLAASRVQVVYPRVHVRWIAGLADEGRKTLERRFDLRNGELLDRATSTWRYRMGSSSSDDVQALLESPAVVDTAYIDREAVATTDPSRLRVLWYPFSDLVDEPSELGLLYPSAWMLLAGAVILWAAQRQQAAARRAALLAVLVVTGLLAVRFPIAPGSVTMGGSVARAANRTDFEFFYGGRIRFEKHLAQAVMLEWYQSDASEAAPRRAMVAISRLATAWFLVSALIVAVLERWSPAVMRYLGLALLAPSALLYFGWWELGYLSLTVLTFPLLAHGLRYGSERLEGSGLAAGVGAALHGAGLVSLAGVSFATMAASDPWRTRISRTLRVLAWGTCAYLGWVLVYQLVLQLPLSPDPGPAAFSPWRPLLSGELRGGHMASPFFSMTTLRDVLMSAGIVGVPLAVVATRLRHAQGPLVRAAWCYAIPSFVFLAMRWPYDGVGGGVDLVVAGFPALYAFAWVCAQDVKATRWAAALLAAAHYLFWRAVLDKNFVPLP